MPLLDVYEQTFDKHVPLSRATRPQDDQRHTEEQPAHPDADARSAVVSDETTEVEHDD